MDIIARCCLSRQSAPTYFNIPCERVQESSHGPQGPPDEVRYSPQANPGFGLGSAAALARLDETALRTCTSHRFNVSGLPIIFPRLAYRSYISDCLVAHLTATVVSLISQRLYCRLSLIEFCVVYISAIVAASILTMRRSGMSP